MWRGVFLLGSAALSSDFSGEPEVVVLGFLGILIFTFGARK